MKIKKNRKILNFTNNTYLTIFVLLKAKNQRRNTEQSLMRFAKQILRYAQYDVIFVILRAAPEEPISNQREKELAGWGMTQRKDTSAEASV